MNANTPTDMAADLLRPLTMDLRQEPLRSPRAKLGRYVIAARSLDALLYVLENG